VNPEHESEWPDFKDFDKQRETVQIAIYVSCDIMTGHISIAYAIHLHTRLLLLSATPPVPSYCFEHYCITKASSCRKRRHKAVPFIDNPTFWWRTVERTAGVGLIEDADINPSRHQPFSTQLHCETHISADVTANGGNGWYALLPHPLNNMQILGALQPYRSVAALLRGAPTRRPVRILAAEDSLFVVSKLMRVIRWVTAVVAGKWRASGASWYEPPPQPGHIAELVIPALGHERPSYFNGDRPTCWRSGRGWGMPKS
jgi:hypothetical protein